MTYDVDGGPPISVRSQRRLEAVLATVSKWLTHTRVVYLTVLLGVVWIVVTGDWSSGSASSGVSLPKITFSDVVAGAMWYAALYVVAALVIVLHELCHWAAFNRFGVSAEWDLVWIRFRDFPIVVLPPLGGLCWASHKYEYIQLSWSEDLVVSLAPLVLVAVCLAATSVIHVFVHPIESPLYVVFVVIVAVGPSPPDYYNSLRETPRYRWDRLVAIEERVKNHGVAEGIV